MEAARAILRAVGVDSVADLTAPASHTVSVEGYEDLTVEKIAPGRVSVAHHYTQRGDLMCDPEIVFRIEEGTGARTPVAYTRHPDVHRHDPAGLPIDEFVGRWSDQLYDQGFVAAAGASETASD